VQQYESNRRDSMKSAFAGMAAGLAGLSNHATANAADSDKPQASVAGYAYDRVRAIQDGRLGLDGFDVSFHPEDIYSLNKHVFGPTRKYEISEVGLIPYLTRYANEDFRAYTLIPVFISRIFRHRNIFVRTDRGIDKPEDLRGKRVATPGYGMSANTWIRGFLQDEHGVQPADIQWVETTKSSDGGDLNAAFGKYFLPEDFPLTKGPVGVDESEMIISGEVDALITAITPQAFLDKHPQVRRLFPDFRAAEQAYYKKTQVFPIMHVVAIRTEFTEARPTLPGEVFSMYSQAKQAAYNDLETTTALKVTLPWVTQEFQDTQKLMGDNFWRYGIGANRKELELVTRYTHEQGLANRRLNVEELFHPATLELTEA